MDEEKKLVEEIQLTIRRVQTGIMTIFTNLTTNKDIIYHFPSIKEAADYAEELLYPEKYADKVKATDTMSPEAAEVADENIKAGEKIDEEIAEGGVHLE